jgi:hypothetical protein
VPETTPEKVATSVPKTTPEGGSTSEPKSTNLILQTNFYMTKYHDNVCH